MSRVFCRYVSDATDRLCDWSVVGYELCRLSLCVGAPQPPVSDELHAAHVFCWKAAVVDYLQKCRVSSHRVGLTVSGLFPFSSFSVVCFCFRFFYAFVGKGIWPVKGLL